MFSTFLKSPKDEHVAPSIYARALYLFDEQKRAICVRTDKLFAGLFLLQWFVAVIWSAISSSQGWQGISFHLQVWQTAVLGGLIVSMPLYYIYKRPGAAITRQVVAVAQMLCSGLLIAASGGRMETHFHVFGSLAFLAFYRDWRPLIMASVVTTLDNLLRGFFLPGTIYGVNHPELWRWLEHGCWVVFCDVFLMVSIRQSIKDMRLMAHRQAELEASKNSIEQEVVTRTAALKLSEQNLRDSEATIRAIFETAADSIVTVSENGSIETANQTCEEMFGYQFHQIFGKHISTLIGSFEDQPCTPDSWPKLRNRGKLRHSTLRLEGIGNSRSRGKFPIEISLSYVDLKGRKLITAIIRDSSERKEAEKRVSEFYSIVSHELRTPLTSIRGSLGLIEGGLTGDLSTETSELVGIARESCDRLIRLINDILDLKKLESGKFEFHKMEASPAELLNMAIAYTSGMAKDRGVRLEVGWATQQSIMADMDRVNQVLVNLVSNAIKFSPRGSAVELSATTCGESVRFAVRDSGKGIPLSDQHKLFNKFQQVDSSDRRQQEGTGLGLAICKAIIEQHGGTIGVESEQEKGSTFWFMVPVSSQDTFAVTAESEKQSLVLVIEEGQDISQLLGTRFLPENCRIIRAQNSEEATVLIAENLPDMVIFNVVEPNESDFELQENLRAIGAKSGKPVVLLASGGDETHTAPLLVDWHKAPVHEGQLLAGVKRALGAGNCPTVLVVEDDYSTRKTVVHQLEAHGVRCVEAACGEEALRLVDSESPQLIVLDIGLPDIDGFEFVKNLKEGVSRLTPLLIYTGRDLSADERRLLTIGFTRYLTKSKASQDDLLNAVDDLLLHMRQVDNADTKSVELAKHVIAEKIQTLVISDSELRESLGSVTQTKETIER